MKNKITTLLLILTLIFCGFTVVVFSETNTGVTLTLTNASGNIGDEVEVSLNVSANSMISAADLIVNYDDSMLSVISTENGKVLSNGMGVSNPKFSSSKIKLSCVHINGFQSAGSIMNMKFKIKNTASGSIPLTLEVLNLVDSQLRRISHKIVNGNITVNTKETNSQKDNSNNKYSENPLSSNAASNSATNEGSNSISTSQISAISSNTQINSSDIKTFNIVGKIVDSKGKNLNGYVLEMPSLNKLVIIDSQGNFTVNDIGFGARAIYIKDNKALLVGTLLFVATPGNRTAISSSGITVNSSNIRLELTLVDNKLKIESVSDINKTDKSSYLIIVLVLVSVILVIGIIIKITFNRRKNL